MTIFFPDVFSQQAGVSFAGVPAVLVKATEGTGYTNPDYDLARTRAAKAGAFFCAYHMLHQGSAVQQAGHAFAVAGKTPLMVDFEPTPGSNPQLADAVAFISEYRRLGGIAYLLYFPRWYWNNLGQPSLISLSGLGMLLVSSSYTSYSESGPGWAAYGGMVPEVWQYTDNGTLNGQHPVDYNAYKGSAADLESLATTGALGGAEPVLQAGDSGPAVKTLQGKLNDSGAKLAVDGSFGAGTLAAVIAFQTARKLTADGIAGPLTWAALDKAPAATGPPPFPAPGGLTAKSIALTVEWTAVETGGKPVASYTIQALGQNGQVYVSETSPVNSAVLAGLVQGWTYEIRVWANGDPVAPPHASLTVTV